MFTGSVIFRHFPQQDFLLRVLDSHFWHCFQRTLYFNRKTSVGEHFSKETEIVNWQQKASSAVTFLL
jgi:hypothetical protein